MLVYYLVLCIGVSKCSSTINYESIRAAALFNNADRLRPFGDTLKTWNPFIHCCIYSSALLLPCRLHSIGFKFPQTHLGAMHRSIHWLEEGPAQACSAENCCCRWDAEPSSLHSASFYFITDQETSQSHTAEYEGQRWILCHSGRIIMRWLAAVIQPVTECL